MQLLAADAVLYSDGGGKVAAVLAPIRGADHIARFFLGILKKGHRLASRFAACASTANPG